MTFPPQIQDPEAAALSGAGKSAQDASAPYWKYFWLLACGWTIAAGGSVAWNMARYSREVESLALETARALFQKDLLYRRWNAMHGGVYVPVSQETQPNPYLKVPERDIVTPSGKRLTLLNPAYMTRQGFELQDQEIGIRGHITSLKPIRPENGPDPWERQALQRFERGLPEVSSIEMIQGQQHLRLMRPLITDQACLRCHADQGYKAGDVRGGISVTVPMSRFAPAEYRHQLVFVHGGLWLLGLGGLSAGWWRLQRSARELMRAEAERERLIGELREALARVKTLSGLIPICASCKKIRDDQGFWQQVEVYVAEHSEARFSHGICPVCAHKLYPEYMSD